MTLPDGGLMTIYGKTDRSVTFKIKKINRNFAENERKINQITDLERTVLFESYEIRNKNKLK